MTDNAKRDELCNRLARLLFCDVGCTRVLRCCTTTGSEQIQVVFEGETFNITITKARGQ